MVNLARLQNATVQTNLSKSYIFLGCAIRLKFFATYGDQILLFTASLTRLFWWYSQAHPEAARIAKEQGIGIRPRST